MHMDHFIKLSSIASRAEAGLLAKSVEPGTSQVSHSLKVYASVRAEIGDTKEQQCAKGWAQPLFKDLTTLFKKRDWHKQTAFQVTKAQDGT